MVHILVRMDDNEERGHKLKETNQREINSGVQAAPKVEGSGNAREEAVA